MLRMLDIKAEKSKVFRSIAAIILLFFIILSLVIISIQNSSFQLSNTRHDKLINKIINTTAIKVANRYTGVVYEISLNEKLKRYIIQGEREEAYKILKPRFVLLKKSNPYVEIMHIILPNGDSFLRVHKPKRYGDNLYNIRAMVRDEVDTHKELYGFESGKYANSFRVMIPLYLDGKYIASFEIGINPEYFLSIAKKVLDAKAFLLIRKKNLYLHHAHKLDFHVKEYFLQNDVYANDMKLLKSVSKDKILREDARFSYEDRDYTVHAIDIKRYDGGLFGKFVFFEDITSLKKAQTIEAIKLFLTLLFFIVVVIFLISYYMQKLKDKITVLYAEHAKELSDREAYLRALLDANPNIIISLVDKNMENTNERFYEFTGYKTVEEFKSEHKCICELFVQREGYLSIYNDGVYWIDKIIKERAIDHFAIMLKGEEEHVFRVFANHIVLDEKDRYIIAFIDVTEMMRLRDELIKSKDLMLAQSKQAAMGEMISMIAHQWRQPISVIGMSVNNILIDIELEELKEQSVKECANEIIEETEYLSKTIDDFRNFFRPDKKRETVSIRTLFESVVKLVGKAFENNNIELEFLGDLDVEIYIYRSEFLQVILNILNNAKDAFSDLDMDGKKVTVSFKRQDNLLFKICDNASGISKEIISKIFDPYFSTKLEKNGTGLGLYMSKIIVQKHLFGTIWAENQRDGGACFMIELPLETGESSE